MKHIVSLLFSFWFAIAPVLADGSFVAPTAVGTAATGQIPGTPTNDAPAAGKVGEPMDATAALGSVSLTTNTDTTVTAGVALTGGDWEVSGVAYFIASATTTVNILRASINTGTAFDGTVGRFGTITTPPASVPGAGYYTAVVIPTFRVIVSSGASPTTLNMVTNATFGVSTLTVGGSIHARRMR